MTTERRTEQTNPQDALYARAREARALMDELAAVISKAIGTPAPHWGHVGDMGHIVESLRDLLGKNG